MINSMTGFGRGTAETEGMRAVVDIRTVNNRNLDVHVRMPQELASLELSMKKQIQATFKRGRFDVTVSFEKGATTEFKLNRELVKGYVDALNAMKAEFGLAGEPSLEIISRIPGVLQSAGTSTEIDPAAVETVQRALAAATAALAAMRATEGKELEAELARRLETIESHVPHIEARAQDLPAAYRERLEKRIAELTRGKPMDETRLAQEAVYLAERSDIAEEIARLKSHTQQFRQTIEGDGAEVGKRLDFLLQEMNREANTILSKSGDIGISDSAITIKTEVEKIREQVQNVE